MNKTSFLPTPKALSAEEALVKPSARVLCALGFQGLLDAAEVAALGSPAKPGYSPQASFLERIAQQSSEGSSRVPTPTDLERARAGEEWSNGPSFSERLALWAWNHHAPQGAEDLRTRHELAVNYRWGFALQELLQSPRGVTEHTTALFQTILLACQKKNWGEGVAAVVQAVRAESPDEAAEFLMWAGQQANVHTAPSLLAVFPSQRSEQLSVWSSLLAQWTNRPADPERSALLDWALTRLEDSQGKAYDVGLVPLLNKAHLAQLQGGVDHRVTAHANAYARHVRSNRPNEPLDQLGLLLASTPRLDYHLEKIRMTGMVSSDQAMESMTRVLSVLRRASVLSVILERFELGTPEERKAETTALRWVSDQWVYLPEKLKVSQTRTNREALLKIQDALEKRRARAPHCRVFEQLGVTENEVWAGLKRLDGRASKEIGAWLTVRAGGWVCSCAERNEDVWHEFYHADPGASRAVRLISGLKIDNSTTSPDIKWMTDWAQSIRRDVAQGKPVDPQLGEAFLQWALRTKVGDAFEVEHVLTAWSGNPLSPPSSPNAFRTNATYECVALLGDLARLDRLNPAPLLALESNIEIMQALRPLLQATSLTSAWAPAKLTPSRPRL